MSEPQKWGRFILEDAEEAVTVDELIAKLQALSPEERAMTVYFDGEPGTSPQAVTRVYVARWQNVVSGQVHTYGVSLGDDFSGSDES